MDNWPKKQSIRITYPYINNQRPSVPKAHRKIILLTGTTSQRIYWPLLVNAKHEGAKDKTHLLGRFGDEGVAVLDTEVGPRLARQEAELTVARLTGRVRDAPQRVGHLHPLEKKIYVFLSRESISLFSIFPLKLLVRWNLSETTKAKLKSEVRLGDSEYQKKALFNRSTATLAGA